VHRLPDRLVPAFDRGDQARDIAFVDPMVVVCVRMVGRPEEIKVLAIDAGAVLGQAFRDFILGDQLGQVGAIAFGSSTVVN